MAGYKQNTKLMAKNSAYLYVQMAVRMIIGLYTVRVILHALGAEDYGIYNVVAGFVTMFTFVTSTLVSASQRFFAYALGRGEHELLNRYFNVSLLCYIILSIILFVVIEAFGWWFVNYKMVIPPERLYAANWVLQISIVAFIIRILAVPSSAMLVANEKMIVYAFVHVLDAFLLLGIAFLLQVVTSDRLIVYAWCMLGISLVSSIIFIGMCRSSYNEASRIRLRWDVGLLKELLSYCGWYMFGTMATVVREQGLNILLNVFFNPIVNAARAIAYQINNAINQFVNSFYQAVRPQITKLTAAEENEKMLSLVSSSSVISFLLMCLVSIPMLVEMPFVLSVWLHDYPEYTVIFARLVIITAMIDTLGMPLTTAVCSLGRIRNYQVITGSILILNLPVSYVLLRLCATPYIVFYVSIVLSCVTQVVRVLFMKKMFRMSILRYTREVIFRTFLISIVSFTATYFLSQAVANDFWSHLIVIMLSILFIVLLSFYGGFTRVQREAMVAMARKKLNRHK
ncbi:MAG: oligosaccharide flippase family protein [Bacteroidaceae bacterium]|nr:oligosaccharide flippase family protein [Bacteroidaceae bacterium]